MWAQIQEWSPSFQFLLAPGEKSAFHPDNLALVVNVYTVPVALMVMGMIAGMALARFVRRDRARRARHMEVLQRALTRARETEGAQAG